MNRKARYFTIFIISAMVLAFLGYHFAQDPIQDVPGSELSLVPSTDPESVAGEASVDQAGTVTTQESSKSNHSSVSTNTNDSSENRENPGQIAEQTEEEPSSAEMLKSALETKDLGLVVPAKHSIDLCRHAPLTDQELVHQLEQLERMREHPQYTWEMAQWLENAKEQKSLMMNECQDLWKLRDQIWATELFDRAMNGDEFARFFYAMWSPRQNEQLFMSLDEITNYQTAALEFTLQNIDEGHPLGLLAMGNSFVYSQHFTRGDHELGMAYLIAAELCSGGAFGQQQMLDSWIENREEHRHGTSPVSTEVILARGTQLYDSHCATSLANSPP